MTRAWKGAPVGMALVVAFNVTGCANGGSDDGRSALAFDAGGLSPLSESPFAHDWSDGMWEGGAPRLRPIVNCVAPAGEDTLVAHLGYESTFQTTLTLPVGRFNTFLPPAFDRGQPSTFTPGRVDNVVTATLGRGGWPIAWKLGLSYAWASGSSPRCVPIFAGASSANPISDQQIFVSWSPATDYSGTDIVYDICVSTVSGSCASNFVVAKTTSPSTVAEGVFGLNPNTTYYVVVRARNGIGNEDANTVEVSTQTCATGESVRNGACVCSQQCGGACTNTASDSQNCGSCRNSCPAGATCSGGECIQTCAWANNLAACAAPCAVVYPQDPNQGTPNIPACGMSVSPGGVTVGLTCQCLQHSTSCSVDSQPGSCRIVQIYNWYCRSQDPNQFAELQCGAP